MNLRGLEIKQRDWCKKCDLVLTKLQLTFIPLNMSSSSIDTLVQNNGIVHYVSTF